MNSRCRCGSEATKFFHNRMWCQTCLTAHMISIKEHERRPQTCGVKEPRSKCCLKPKELFESRKFSASVSEIEGALIVAGHGSYRLKL